MHQPGLNLEYRVKKVRRGRPGRRQAPYEPENGEELEKLRDRYGPWATRGGRLRHRLGFGQQADGFRILQECVDACHNHASLDGQQFEADQRHSSAGVNDDSLVEDAVHNLRQTTLSYRFFNSHGVSS